MSHLPITYSREALLALRPTFTHPGVTDLDIPPCAKRTSRHVKEPGKGVGAGVYGSVYGREATDHLYLR